MRPFDPSSLASNLCRTLLSVIALTSLALSGPDALASEGERVASEQGCLNCHSREARSAPSLDRLVDRMQRKGDQAEALQHVLREMRGQSSIHSHQMVSDESALVVLRWLAQGAK